VLLANARDIKIAIAIGPPRAQKPETMRQAEQRHARHDNLFKKSTQFTQRFLATSCQMLARGWQA
jgi:hypothetical protein